MSKETHQLAISQRMRFIFEKSKNMKLNRSKMKSLIVLFFFTYLFSLNLLRASINSLTNLIFIHGTIKMCVVSSIVVIAREKTK